MQVQATVIHRTSDVNPKAQRPCLTAPNHSSHDAMTRRPSPHTTSSSRSPQVRSASFALSNTSNSRQPSSSRAATSSQTPTLRRRGTSLSLAERGPDPSTAHTDHALHEEIAEIKRYEDFTTIDWVQDAAREQLRRKARRKEKAGFFAREGGLGWRRKLWESYDAGQAWIVVTLVGAAIGLNAAFLNIVTEWLSDIKLGYCTTAFYLNENFCCWGAENGNSLPFLCVFHD